MYNVQALIIRRKKNGWSQIQLASRVGCTSSMISLIESRERQGSPQLIKRIAYELGISMDDVVMDDEVEKVS
jgi:transcriptional regulator with XRE-family HTH domain